MRGSCDMLRRHPLVTMTPVELNALPEYSCSLPTGTTIGKRWRKRIPYYTNQPLQCWLVAEYVDHPDPNLTGIKWRQVVLVNRFGFPVNP